MQEGDYLVDNLIIFLLMSVLVYGRSAKANWQYLIVVVLCIKGSYWFDREESMNSKVDVKLKGVKDAIQ